MSRKDIHESALLGVRGEPLPHEAAPAEGEETQRHCVYMFSRLLVLLLLFVSITLLV